MTATPGYQNKWAFDGSYQNQAGGMDTIIQLNGTLKTHRFCNLDSDILLNSGYGTVPAGVYIDPVTGGFSIMAWIKLSAYANGATSDNILFKLDEKTGTGRLLITKDNVVIVTRPCPIVTRPCPNRWSVS